MFLIEKKNQKFFFQLIFSFLKSTRSCTSMVKKPEDTAESPPKSLNLNLLNRKKFSFNFLSFLKSQDQIYQIQYLNGKTARESC